MTKTRVLTTLMLTLVVATALALTACGAKADTDPAKLAATWNLKGFGAPDGLRDADPTVKTVMTLTADGKCYGTTGVNEFRGAYESKAAGDIRFGQPAMTRMAGTSSAMQQESEFVRVLELAQHYEFDGDGYLVLTAENNDTLAVFTPGTPVPVPTSTPTP